MKFLNILSWASFALVVPAARQQTVTGVIANSVSTLEGAIGSNLNEITTAVDTIKGSTSATLILQLSAVIATNYNAVISALATAITAIVQVTTGAVGGVAGQAQGLTEQQIQQLIDAVEEAIDVLNGISAAVTITVTDLKPATYALMAAQVIAVKQLLNPFVAPVVLFGQAVEDASAEVTIVVEGLTPAVKLLVSTYEGGVTSIGLPALSI
ncbi:hypothetical protein ACJ41O_003938 [Fusarium nematophilum]